MATGKPRPRRRSKTARQRDAEMQHIDERIAEAYYSLRHGGRRGGGDLEDYLAAAWSTNPGL